MDKPDDLASSGGAFWDAATSPDRNIVFRPDEYRLLAEACRQLDVLDELDRQFAADPRYVVLGSTGQPVISPLLSHRDKILNRYQSLCRQLSIPDESEERARQRAEAMSGNMSALGRHSWQVRKGSA